MPKLPTGTVTFLFTDIEGSTGLLQRLGREFYRDLQELHGAVLRDAIADGGGVEVRTEGDSFFAVFPTAEGALTAAIAAQRGLSATKWPEGCEVRVRMGMHTGRGVLGAGGADYVGIDINRAARIAAAGHGGQILLSDTTHALVITDLPVGVILRDLGLHRLKDLVKPEHLHDVQIDGLGAEFPQPRSLEIPTNLPTELTSFVGRESELAAVKRLLESARLVTLTGPGGSGKTRLALRAASDVLDRFPDGVFFIELASITDPDLVPSVIASALRTGEEGPRPVLEKLQIKLRHETSLLVLDNFEQVIEASSGIGMLMSAAPRIRVLVTSRTPLRIRGEQEFPIPPLGMPDTARLPPLEELPRIEALTLFVERAMAVDPSFILDEENIRTVVEICRRLDGLPLAIELAASRLRLLSPSAMLERLDPTLPLLAKAARDLPERQRTLRSTIAWSYDLLPPEIGSLFRRICVFAGGFTISGADSVGNPKGELGFDTLEGLDALLDSSLVRRSTATAGRDRFETLQTVREYGLERLENDHEALAIRRRHAHYCLQLAEATEPELRGPDLEHHLEVLRVEHDNMRAALIWAIHHDEGEMGLRLVTALWRFWHLHGHLSAGRHWANQTLALPSAAGRTRFRAHALLATGSLAYWQRAHRDMLNACQEAMAIFREHDDLSGIALATYDMGFALAMDGRLEDADEMVRESRALFEEIGDSRGVGDSLFALAGMSRKLGDVLAARAQAEQALRLHKDLGDIFGMHGDLYVLGRAAADGGDLDSARELFLETLGVADHMGYSTGIALSLDLLANQEIARGRPAGAMRLAGASETIKESVGGEAPPELLDVGVPREQARQLLGEEEVQAAWDEGRAMSLEETLAYARARPEDENRKPICSRDNHI
jgi:predicted ATPase/class 3 adenylate cyclase